MELLDKLTEDIYSSFLKDGSALVGDDDFVTLCGEAKGRFTHAITIGSFTHMNSLRIGGFDVVSNATPGTRGWIIGSKEAIERMRAAIWSNNYYRLFNETPDGLLYALSPK